MKYEPIKNQGNLHMYEFYDGRKLRRYEVCALIVNLFDGDAKLTIPEISKLIGLDAKSVNHLIRTIVTKGDLVSEKKQRYTIYSKPNKSMLEAIWFPQHSKFIEDTKDLKGKKYKAEQFPNVRGSFTTPLSMGFTNSIYNNNYEN
jgi:hypothetical protein